MRSVSYDIQVINWISVFIEKSLSCAGIRA